MGKILEFLYRDGTRETVYMSNEDIKKWKEIWRERSVPGKRFESESVGHELGINPVHVIRWKWMDGHLPEQITRPLPISDEYSKAMSTAREKLEESKKEKREAEETKKRKLRYPGEDKEDWILLLIDCECGEYYPYKAPTVRTYDVCKSCSRKIFADYSKGLVSSEFGQAILFTNKYNVPRIPNT